MKIFGIGLSRTGTLSLTHALTRPGWRTTHLPRHFYVIKNCDAATDITVCLWMQKLDHMYPRSKFILTERDMDSWLASCSYHHGPRNDLSWHKPEVRDFLLSVRRDVYGAEYFDETLWRNAYHRHQEHVGQYFQNREQDLLRMDICAGEGWAHLCSFLGKPAPAIPFPHENRRVEIKSGSRTKTPPASPASTLAPDAPAPKGHVLYIWELGSSLGHLGHFLPLALEMKKRGYRITAMLRETENVETMLGEHRFNILRTPIAGPAARRLAGPPMSYAEILAKLDYLDPQAFQARMQHWVKTIQSLAPNLIIADHAPTALVAARITRIPCALYGHGFFSPPRVYPLPPLRDGPGASLGRLKTVEQKIVGGINAALIPFRARPLAQLHELFAVDADLLLTYPELDHYPGRKKAEYFGNIYSLPQGEEPPWRGKQKPRVFAYLKANYTRLEEILKVLSRLSGSVIVFADGLKAEMREKYRSPTLYYSDRPFNIHSTAQQCDLAVCHAGIGTIVPVLLHAHPVLLLPTQLEQYLTGRRVQELGAGLFALGEGNENLEGMLKQLLEKSDFTLCARAFADKYRAYSQQAILDRLANRCESLIKQAV